MILKSHSLLAFVLPLVFADVEFTTPSAGADISVGTINVKWKDSGKAPPISGLTVYTLNLMVGGNDVGDMVSIGTLKSGGNFAQGNTAKGLISADTYGPVPNGFFLQMISTSATGGTVINYSDRFTITGLTGTSNSKYSNAAAALQGNTNGPPRSGNAIASISSGSLAASSTTKSQATVTITDGGGVHSGVPTIPNSANDSGSNTGVIAGAVLGCIAFLIAIIAFGIWAYIRRKRRRDGPRQLDDKDEVAGQPPVELVKQPSVTTQPKMATQPSVTTLSELRADRRTVEIGDGIPPSELDSTHVRAELEGDCIHSPSEMGTPVELGSPLTPVSPSVFGEETLDPTLPRSGF